MPDDIRNGCRRGERGSPQGNTLTDEAGTVVCMCNSSDGEEETGYSLEFTA